LQYLAKTPKKSEQIKAPPNPERRLLRPIAVLNWAAVVR
jgi:hypothetical protein